MRDKVEYREQCSEIQAEFPTELRASKQPLARQLPSTASALLTGVKKLSCTYCRQGHASHLWKNVTDKTARKDILRQQGRCFICPRKSHSSSSLPPRPDGAVKTTDQSTKTDALYASIRDSILLQTAQIYIHAVDSKEKIRARQLFDFGSQLSFIRRVIARCLNLPIVGQESLDTKVFGSNYSQVSDYDIVHFTVESIRRDFSVTMEAHYAPNICDPIY